MGVVVTTGVVVTVTTGVEVIVPVGLGVAVISGVTVLVATGVALTATVDVGVAWFANEGRAMVRMTATKTLTATLPATAMQIKILIRILVLIIRVSLSQKWVNYFHLYIQSTSKSTTIIAEGLHILRLARFEGELGLSPGETADH